MRKIQIFLVLLFGLLAVLLEFRSIKQDALFGINMLEEIPLVVLCFVTLVFLYKKAIQFKQTKKYISFLPALTGIVFITVILEHKLFRLSLDNSSTVFTATNYNLGSDGGFILHFKTNQHLKAEKRDHWMVTYYWGSYKMQGDTLLLDIPLNFKMGRHAILQSNVLTFTDDTVHFEVHRQ